MGHVVSAPDATMPSHDGPSVSTAALVAIVLPDAFVDRSGLSAQTAALFLQRLHDPPRRFSTPLLI